jgi:hypothetical protein
MKVKKPKGEKLKSKKDIPARNPVNMDVGDVAQLSAQCLTSDFLLAYGSELVEGDDDRDEVIGKVLIALAGAY